MNPVERDIRGYFGIAPEDSILEHYGTKRHSGRYPWGSGENPYQRSGDFLSRVEELKKSGMKEKDILQTINDSLPEEYKMGATEFRMAQRRAIHERQQLKYDRARALSQDGLGPTEIGREMGLSESTVRSMLKNDKPDKYTRTKEIAETLRKEVDKKGMIDVSEGTNLVLGVSEGDLDDAIFVLEAEHGYQRYGVGIRQPTNINQQTNITVLAKPEYDQKYAYQHQNEIQSLGEYHSEDGGETFKKLQRPSSMSSDRVCIRYGDEGGLDKDGVIEIRRGVADLNLGKSHYAQVRIMVDDSHYLKGMAVYSDDIPEGYDVVFNTNKKSGTPKMKVLKPIKDDPDNPFGASIKANGQSTYIGEDGKEHLSPINRSMDDITSSALDIATNAAQMLYDVATGQETAEPIFTPVLNLSDYASPTSWAATQAYTPSAETAERVYRSNELAQRIGGNQNGAFTKSRSDNSDVVNAISQLGNRVDRMAESISKMKLVLDSGKTVGELAPKIDSNMGGRNILAERGVI